MKKKYKASMRGRRIAFFGICAIIICLLIGLIINIATPSDSGKNDSEKLPVSNTGSDASQSQDNGDEKTTGDETATGKMDISFDTDSAYAESHKYCVGVNRQENVITVYEKDENGKYTKPIKAMLCSCGIPNGNDTPAGTFKTTDKVRWLWLVNNTYGQYTMRIDGHIWFHSVPYYHQDPSSLEYEEYNKLGENASLGCVRVCVADAQWLYENLDWNTIVTIYDSDNPGPLGKPQGIKLDLTSENRGWDPTDTDPDNPWK